jgi:peptidoglycan hydrolase-like protein with peptidoglycan-binding domain
MSTRFFPNYNANKITSRFGVRTHPVTGKPSTMHNGIDLEAKAPDGSSELDYITAHTAGKLSTVGYDNDSGNYVNIRVSDDTVMTYCHLASPCKLTEGSFVEEGQIIGYMGATGRANGAHLHWGIKKYGKWIDPEPYLDADYITKNEATIVLPVLKRGVTGNKTVKAMQLLLEGNGFPCGKGATGNFGSGTENALNKYKKANDLNPNGVCDEKAWNKLLGVE